MKTDTPDKPIAQSSKDNLRRLLAEVPAVLEAAKPAPKPSRKRKTGIVKRRIWVVMTPENPPPIIYLPGIPFPLKWIGPSKPAGLSEVATFFRFLLRLFRWLRKRLGR
jgi:hypothetical protein